MMLLALAACQPKEQVPEATEQIVVITATQAETRTVVGENSMGGGIPILWETSDKIWVRSALQETGSSGVAFRTRSGDISNGGRTADFRGLILNAGPYIAVYPEELVVSNKDNETVTLNVPKEQTYRENSFAKGANISAAMWATGTEVTFSSIAGSLRLRLNGFNSINKIVITDNDPKFPLWGECTLLYSASGITASWENDAEDCNKLVLNCGQDVTLSQSSSVDFYFAVPEGAFAKGYTCELYNANGEIVSTLTDSGNHAVGRNQILTVETGQPTFVGEGTPGQPYQISNAADLARMAELCNGEYADLFKDKSYKQTADIDMTGVPHQCIGAVKAKAFKGTYDGGGFTISNLAPSAATEAAAGLFAYVDGAEISHLNVNGYTNFGTIGEQGVIAGNAVASKFNDIKVVAHAHFVKCATGGLVGMMEGGSIENCHFEGKVQNEQYDTFQGVTVVSCLGGIVGCANNAAISGCTTMGEITSRGEQLGGIAGQVSQTSIDNCKVLAGSTVGSDNYYSGGIVGEMLTGGSITNCEVQAHVVSRLPGAGGIVAWLQSGDISNCVVGKNALVRSNQNMVGGIVGQIYHKNTKQTVNISNCTVLCDVIGGYTVGGIVGEYNPTHDETQMTMWNCASVEGEIVNAGYASSKWTMVGGLVGWARMGNTYASLNIVNCFSDPASIRCEFPDANEVDMGGLIGEQAGANATVLIQGCYTSLAPGRAVVNSNQNIPDSYYNYASLVGNPTKTNFENVYSVIGLSELGNDNDGSSTNCQSFSPAQMVDGTLLNALNGFVAGYAGALQLKNWVTGANGYPVFEGMSSGSVDGKKKPLRVSVIGDSLSSFDGYVPQGYSCHYPATDGDVTSAAQTYWYMLTYDYLKNAVWDTNLGCSSSAVTRCTDPSKSSSGWYTTDFCIRYIEHGGIGSPDIIIINGGANDWAHNCYYMLGDDKIEMYPTETPHRPDDAAMNAAYAVADACKTLDEAKALPDGSFVEAYVKLVKMMTIQYPNVKIVVLIHDTLTPDLEEAMLHIAEHYSDHCRAVDLYQVNGFNDLGWNFEYLALGYQPNIPKHDFNWENIVTSGDLRQNRGDHYSAVAMKFIANKIYTEIGAWLEGSASYNENGSGSINDFGNENGEW